MPDGRDQVTGKADEDICVRCCDRLIYFATMLVDGSDGDDEDANAADFVEV